MTEQGIVIDITGDYAKIRLTKNPECGKCGLCSGGGKDAQILTVRREKPLRLNQLVTLEINQKALSISSFLLYGIPLSGFIAGAIVGYIIGKEVMATIFAISFMVIDFFIVRIITKKTNLAEKAVRIVEAQDT